MKEFNKVIGYDSIKLELERICDWMINPQKYQKLGISFPGGLFLYGEPGVGKTLLASCFIDASKRKSFICRKNEPNGDFVKVIKKTFEDAVENAPSIIVLDDIDKYANEDEGHTNAEEFVTVQSCIDDIKGKNVFVLATANRLHKLPISLLRAGRFDKIIKVKTPMGEDAVNIVKYYLSKKSTVKNVNAREIARILNGQSCAELETVVNEAGFYAGYKNKDYIDMDDMIKACMRVVFGAPEIVDGDDCYDYDDGNSDNSNATHCYQNNRLLTAYHEAGHVVVAERLEPESVNIVSISKYDGDFEGITSYYQPKDYWQNKIFMENRVMVLLGGKAATEVYSGNTDVGAHSDIQRALRLVESFVDDYCSIGFDKTIFGQNSSDKLLERKETIVFSEMEKYYQKAKKILIDNKPFFDNITKALLEQTTLTSRDIKEIKEKSNIA